MKKEAVKNDVYPGADENTPSRAQYFTWINNTNEGTTQKQTFANFDFFAWLKEEYGMQLDIYAFDAGNLDGAGYYGSLASEKNQKQFPEGFEPIYERAKSLGFRLGIWGGADGFGNSSKEEKKRIEEVVSLCRDYDFMLFKFDTVCGSLRPEKRDTFMYMMNECRKYCPDLIVLNHRNKLGEAQKHSTTFLWEGAETYIDVHMANKAAAPHHRQGALSRGSVPELRRLTEDHGVCLSSCLDFWEDDLILQAFNRCLILAPEIYGNPWLLNDTEYPKLARIFNLHRQYRDILVNGIKLPESQYGPAAVSRGNAGNRFLTLRNLSWTRRSYLLELNEEIGLKTQKTIEVRQLHPVERILGYYNFGDKVEVDVFPFRSCLLQAAVQPIPEIGVIGCDYEIIKNIPGAPTRIKLLAFPGSSKEIKINQKRDKYEKAKLDGQDISEVLKGRAIKTKFPGTPHQEDWHRKLGELNKVEVPDDAEALYEAACFAADNNALEIRSLQRSGPTAIPQVEKARDQFFKQDTFIYRGCWDKYMFDGKSETFFDALSLYMDLRIDGGCLRVDFKKLTEIDRIEIIYLQVMDDIKEAVRITPGLTASVSPDLNNWIQFKFNQEILSEDTEIPVVIQKTHLIKKTKGRKIKLTADIPKNSFKRFFRYFRLPEPPDRIVSFKGYYQGKTVSNGDWKGSNLFAPYQKTLAVAAWNGKVEIGSPPQGSYLCIALDGKHGVEKTCCAARLNGELKGAPDRGPSYQSNIWEIPVKKSEENYTYYIPVTPDMYNQELEIVTLLLEGGTSAFKPSVWLTTYPVPYVEKELVLT